MGLIQSLFRSKKDEAIEALRAVVAENQRSHGWQKAFLHQIEEAKRKVERARLILAVDPTDENAKAYVAAKLEERDAQLLGDVPSITDETLSTIRMGRLVPA
ncbi:MAG TPA: hypothetical protein VFC07_06395, partial [Verrucomicrobiae bacterium]|nr:hypothetical protein [Verrucomicrobiae bacterium]